VAADSSSSKLMLPISCKIRSKYWRSGQKKIGNSFFTQIPKTRRWMDDSGDEIDTKQFNNSIYQIGILYLCMRYEQFWW
jgi:hypothetical protein